jgi:hypothetical protein
MIGKLAIAVVLAAVLAGTLCGCFNLDAKAPDGPYVTMDSNGSGQIREFLKTAREDGIISKNQYEVLMKRVKDDD